MTFCSTACWYFENIQPQREKDSACGFEFSSEFLLLGTRVIQKRRIQSPKLILWCAVSQFGIIGPYIFEEEGVNVTLASEFYVSMLKNFVSPKWKKLLKIRSWGDFWLQQDGATAYTAWNLLNVLRRMFLGRLVSLRGDLGWIVRSPKLSICDFFLLEYLKKRCLNIALTYHHSQRRELLKKLTAYRAIYVNVLFKTSEIDSTSVLLIIAAILNF